MHDAAITGAAWRSVGGGQGCSSTYLRQRFPRCASALTGLSMSVKVSRTTSSVRTGSLLGYDSSVGDGTLDAKGLRQLFERHGPLVYRRALRILGNSADAEEATQEVFVRVMRGADGFEERSQVTTWLYRITTNYCLNLVRDRKRQHELLAENHGPDTEVQRDAPPDQLVMLRHVLANADEDQARAAIYVYLDGMSHQEAAELLGVSRRTVGHWLERLLAEVHALEVKSVPPPASDDGRALALPRARAGGSP